jgi:cruciform cutting endonuclease 1
MNAVLSKCKVSTLNQIGLLCGFASATTKQNRVQSIISGLELYKHIEKQYNITDFSVLSVDIGYKNFAYCQNRVDLTSNDPIRIANWNKLNLDETFGSSYTPLSYSPLHEEKQYQNYIAMKIGCRLSDLSPDITVVETQRTKSNNNQVTLPTILKNYTLENLIYNEFYRLNLLALPMTSAQMISFWINRFICKKSIKLAKNAKQFRNMLVLSWLSSSTLVKFDKLNLSNVTPVTKTLLLSSLNLPTTHNKIDDLVDSLLYNLTIIHQLKNQRLLIHYLLNGLDLTEFVINHNQIQLDLIADLVVKNNLTLLSDFAKYINYSS